MTALRDAAAPLTALAAVLAGIAAGHIVEPGPAVGWLVLAGALAAGALAVRGRSRAALLLAALTILSISLTVRARHGVVDTPFSTEGAGSQRAIVDAELVGDPTPRQWETTATIRVQRMVLRARAPQSGGNRHVVARASRPAASRLTVLEAGDRVRLEGRFAPLGPFEASRRDLHLVAEFQVADVLDAGPSTSLLMGPANAVRNAVLEGITHVPARHRALVAGFLLGDVRGLSPALSESFRIAGLSHLLVVSGSNVAFVLALLGPLRRRLGLTGRFATGLAVVLVFAAATRFEPSVLRASVMAALAMLAAFTGRPTAGLRLLVLSAVALLLVDPFLVHSIAFRLSCAASAGILVWSPSLAERIPGPIVIRESLATTTAAQLGVAPVLIPLAGGLPVVALPANLAAAWAAGPLTMWGLAAGVAAWVIDGLSPEVADFLHVPTAFLAGYLEAVATVAARMPLVVNGPAAAGVAVVMALGLAVARARRRLVGDGCSHAPARPSGT